MTTILKHTFDRNMAQMQVNKYTVHQWNSYCKHYRIWLGNIRSVAFGRHLWAFVPTKMPLEFLRPHFLQKEGEQAGHCSEWIMSPEHEHVPWKLMVGRCIFLLNWSLFRGELLRFWGRVCPLIFKKLCCKCSSNCRCDVIIASYLIIASYVLQNSIYINAYLVSWLGPMVHFPWTLFGEVLQHSDLMVFDDTIFELVLLNTCFKRDLPQQTIPTFWPFPDVIPTDVTSWDILQ